MSWTEETEAQAKTLWAAGYSASQIANQIGGVTRNAVIGKLHRLGLTKSYAPRLATHTAQGVTRARAKPTSHGGHAFKPMADRAAQKRKEIAAERERLQAAEATDLPPDKATIFSILELNHDTCRWPIGDPQDRDTFGYCGKKPCDGLPYCMRHCAIAYVEPGYRASARREQNREGRDKLLDALRRSA